MSGNFGYTQDMHLKNTETQQEEGLARVSTFKPENCTRRFGCADLSTLASVHARTMIWSKSEQPASPAVGVPDSGVWCRASSSQTPHCSNSNVQIQAVQSRLAQDQCGTCY